MYTIDASIFVRELDHRDPHYGSCHELLDRLASSGTAVVVPLTVLPEIAAAVGRLTRDPFRARLFAEFIRELPHISFVPLDESIARAATEIAADYALRGMDACYVAVAHQYGCTLVSYDREIRDRAAKLIAVLTPEEALPLLPTPPT